MWRYGKPEGGLVFCVAILIALGANLASPDFASPRETLAAAVDRLAACGLAVEARSRWYRSPAWPPSDQPDYVNGVIRVMTECEPEALLLLLQQVEEAFGRVRTIRNAARVLDLDLVAYNRKVMRTADDRLILPHPWVQDRPFVLLPLRDVAPGWTHPVSGLSVEAMLQALDCSATVPLDGGPA